MKLSRFALALLLPAGAALAQTATPPPPPVAPPPPAKLDETIVLNPFVVTMEADDGYASKETLSGTRLRTEIKNVASSMSIVTSELLRDMGATSFYDIVDFIPSTFSYGSNEGDSTGNGLRTGFPFVVRGYRSDSLATNFFTSQFPIDTYNTDRVTFTRGPNAILFGIGNPGGTVNIATNKADLRKNFNKLEIKVDSFGSFRSALDANMVITPKKLGVRVDILHEDRRSNIKPTYNKRDSIFGTITYQPTKNSTLYVMAESNEQTAQIARPFGFYDWYTPWVNAGRPIKATARDTTAGAGWEFFSSNGFPVLDAQTGTVMNWARMAYGARVRVRNAAVSTVAFDENSPNLVVPLDVNIVGNGDLMEYENQNYSAIFQQRLAENLYLELAAKRDTMFRMNREMGANEVAIQVDANAQLPDGTPNPNVGRPYIDVRAQEQFIPTTLNQLRATLSYEKDLRHIKVFKRGLGRLSLGGLWNNEYTHQYLDQTAEVNLTPLGTITDLSNAVNLIQRRWYFNPGQTNYYNGDFKPVSGNGINTSWEYARAQPRNNRNRTNSYALATQLLLLDDLLALTGGLRRDELTVNSTNYVKDARGLWPNSHAGTPIPEQNYTGRPYLFGAVLNLHPNFGLFYNRATNYRSFVQGARTINQELIPTQAGAGEDLGVKFNFGRLLSGSVTYFETSQTNTLDGTTRGRKAGWINSIWDVIDPSKRPDLSVNWSDLRDQTTQGTEIELVINPTKNLRMYLTASRNINRLVNRSVLLTQYLEENYPIWQANAATPLRGSLTDGSTVGDLIPKIKAEAVDDQLLIGIVQSRVFEWQGNLITRYQFDRTSPLKGLAVGTAVRWRNAPTIGYYRIATVNTPLGVLDPTRPIKGVSSTNVDAWIDYSRPFTAAGKKINWVAQFRVQNLLDDTSAMPWTADVNDLGTPYLQQRKPVGSIQYSLSSTFEF